jgi:hypothetical protein
MLDEVLRSILMKRLLPPTSKDRSIVDGQNAPLATFSARIDAAYQFGLISHFLARDLHLIRKIRNEFAHHPFDRTFDTAPVLDWVCALETASDYNRRNPDVRKNVGPEGVKWDFLGIAAWILYDLDREIGTVTKVQEHGPEFGYIDWSQLPPDIKKALDADGAA